MNEIIILLLMQPSVKKQLINTLLQDESIVAQIRQIVASDPMKFAPDLAKQAGINRAKSVEDAFLSLDNESRSDVLDSLTRSGELDLVAVLGAIEDNDEDALYEIQTFVETFAWTRQQAAIIIQSVAECL